MSKDPKHLRQQAETYRRMAKEATDVKAAESLKELAAAYEKKAQQAELDAGLNE